MTIDLDPVEPRTAAPRCTVDGCRGAATERGLCLFHARRPTTPTTTTTNAPPARVIHHQGEPVPDTTTTTDEYKCTECGRTFDSEHGRAIHLARTHGIRGATKGGTPSAPRQPREAPPEAPAQQERAVADLPAPTVVDVPIELTAAQLDILAAAAFLAEREPTDLLDEYVVRCLAEANADPEISRLAKLRAARRARD